MTEAEWLTCEDPKKMVDVAVGGPRAGDRVCRLYVSAFWHWQAFRLPEPARSDLQKRAAAMEHWAENGKLPKGIRPSRSTNVIFFNRAAGDTVKMTVRAPGRSWKDLAPGALAVQPPLLRCIFGNPFRPVPADPSWGTSTVTSLARQMYESRDFSPLPILADAHKMPAARMRPCSPTVGGSGPHARGCWVVDLVLGKM